MKLKSVRNVTWRLWKTFDWLSSCCRRQRPRAARVSLRESNFVMTEEQGGVAGGARWTQHMWIEVPGGTHTAPPPPTRDRYRSPKKNSRSWYLHSPQERHPDEYPAARPPTAKVTHGRREGKRLGAWMTKWDKTAEDLLSRSKFSLPARLLRSWLGETSKGTDGTTGTGAPHEYYRVARGTLVPSLFV